MKMIQLMLIGLMGLLASSVVSATTLTNATNNYLMTQCSLLANDIRITLTNGVVGGIECDDALNVIALSTCHTAGLTSARSASVTTCTDPLDPATCTTAIDTVTGSAFPTATTRQGTVASEFPGQTCDELGVQAEAVADSMI